MKRIFHPWHVWEDYQHNFYGGVRADYERDKSLQLYANLLRDEKRFSAALKQIITAWKHSCEHNLTNESLNKIAYLGQAACALVYNVPHHECMGAYNLLTPEEQVAANATAQKYLDLWLEEHKRVYN